MLVIQSALLKKSPTTGSANSRLAVTGFARVRAHNGGSRK